MKGLHLLPLAFPLPFRVLSKSALVFVSAAIGLCACGALVAASVRVLPWLLDPALPAAVARPFARSLFTLALEASILVGWPVGWAIAAQRFSERGEARVLRLLGERERRTILRLFPQGAVFFAILFGVSMYGGADAGAPGRVVSDLLAQGRAACAEAHSPIAYPVPFADAAWLCGTGEGPRIFLRAPGGLSNASFTASSVSVSGDLRRIDLHDARIAGGPIRAQIGTMHVRGLVPFTHASVLPPVLRAFVFATSALFSAAIAGASMLRAPVRGGFGRVVAGALGVTGPLVALFLVRTLEQSAPDEARMRDLAAFALAPFVTALVVALAARGFAALSRVRKLAPQARG